MHSRIVQHLKKAMVAILFMFILCIQTETKKRMFYSLQFTV
jgi:hypothetical protein